MDDTATVAALPWSSSISAGLGGCFATGVSSGFLSLDPAAALSATAGRTVAASAGGLSVLSPRPHAASNTQSTMNLITVFTYMAAATAQATDTAAREPERSVMQHRAT